MVVWLMEVQSPVVLLCSAAILTALWLLDMKSDVALPVEPSILPAESLRAAELTGANVGPGAAFLNVPYALLASISHGLFSEGQKVFRSFTGGGWGTGLPFSGLLLVVAPTAPPDGWGGILFDGCLNISPCSEKSCNVKTLNTH